MLCQDIAVLPGRGDLQTSWTFRWPATGQPPASYDGFIDGGTGAFGAADGTFHAQNQPNGERLTLTIGKGSHGVLVDRSGKIALALIDRTSTRGR